jgi:ribulose-phosphate 3-epimerase
MKHLIAPSIIAADFTKLASEIELINNSNADWLHVDVMDGRFVPNITFGMMLVDAMKKLSSKPLDVHLMILEPEKYIEQFREVGADVITVHYEACSHLHRTIQQIKNTGAKVGVAINPHTNVDLLYDVLEDVDVVCIMSVNPGFGGQKFIYQTIPKIKRLRSILDERNLNALIEIDGGVGLQNAEEILKAGANVLVAGNSVFGASNPIEAISKLKQIGHLSKI